jgi:hypothetical protein
MPITKEEFEKALDLNKLKNKWVEKLERIADKLGLIQVKEVATNGGRIDLVWYVVFENNLPDIGEKLPLVGFEIETSWRTRKHLKGDLFNLLELSPSLGVLLLLRKGFKTISQLKGNIEAFKKYADGISGLSNIQIWTDENIEQIYDKLFEENKMENISHTPKPPITATSNREKIIKFLTDNPGAYCDDCLSIRLDITPRQQVNKICRRLVNNGIIERRREKCQFCKKDKINNRLITPKPQTTYFH